MPSPGTFLPTSISRALRVRLLLFTGASLTLALLVCWAAITALIQIGAMRQRFDAVQYESLRIGAHLQAGTVAMHSALMAYELSGEEKEWSRFETDAKELSDWLAQERSTLKSEREKTILSEIDGNLGLYLGKAQELGNERRENKLPSIQRIHNLDTATHQLLSDDAHLAEAHERALETFLDSNAHSLRLLELFMIGAFTSVFGLAGWGASMAYKHAIAPLRVQLIESRALLERREKLASLGVLAAGVAHEIRNPLTAIKARLFTQQKKLERDSLPYKDSKFIAAEITRLERIVRDFLEFARPGDPERVCVEAGMVLQEARDLLIPEMEKDRLILEQSDRDHLTISVDRNQIKQVLINLIRNAAESSISEAPIRLRVTESRISLEGRPAIVLEVSDRGHGIPIEVQKRLFDPFFTTKPNGTGLGLSIAAQIVEKHEGKLRFQTVPGQGTTFGVVLPTCGAEEK